VLKKLNKLKYASERTEKNFKEEVEKAMDDLKAFVDDIISRYR
jgi:ribosome recycling factor